MSHHIISFAHIILWCNNYQLTTFTLFSVWVYSDAVAEEIKFIISSCNKLNHTVIPIKIYSDSKSAIATAKDKKVSSENKHYDVKLLIIREWIDSGFIKYWYKQKSCWLLN